MTDIVIEPATEQQLSSMESWAVRNDSAKVLFKSSRMPLVGAGRASWHWVALKSDEVVAIATLELNKEHVGYITCVVKPGRLRQGIGSRLFEFTLTQPEAKELAHLHAAIDQLNTPAQKILERHGFSRVGFDSDGRIEFARHARRHQ